MTDQEQLAGYDEDGTDRTAELPALETPPSVPAASSPELRTLVAVAVGAIVVATLYIAQDVLIPMTLAVMLSFVLSPLVDVLRRIGLWRARRGRAECARRVGSHRSDRHAARESGRDPGGRCPALCRGRPEQGGEYPGSLRTTRVASITRAPQRRQACDRPGHRSSRPAATGQNRRGGSSWRHAATAARRRARNAEVLGARGRSGRYRAGPWTPRDHRHCA